MIMTTYYFYNEIQISECPMNFYDLKEKVKKLFILNDEQISHSIISYVDKENNVHYIFDQNQYEEIIPIMEKIILKVDLLNDDNCLTMENNMSREYNAKENNYIQKNEEKKEKNTVQIIKCNSCKKEIQGIRYLCGICHDFNLCYKCEMKLGKNHGHPLLKIRGSDQAPISFKCKIEENIK